VARDLLSYVPVQDEDVIVFHPGIELRHRGEQGLPVVRAVDFGEADQNLVIIFEYQFLSMNSDGPATISVSSTAPGSPPSSMVNQPAVSRRDSSGAEAATK
jgi:hypothetical protein